MEKNYTFYNDGAKNTLTIFRVKNQVNVIIDTNVVDEYIYEDNKKVPIKTHKNVNTMKIAINDTSLKILQHEKSGARRAYLGGGAPVLVDGRREMVDNKRVFLEQLNGRDLEEVIMGWVKEFIEYFGTEVSPDYIQVQGSTLNDIDICTQRRVRPD